MALGQLDQFVERTAHALGMTPALLDRVRREKIDWIVGPEAVMHELIRAPAHGVANLQLDAVLTQHSHHPHELAHILINLARVELRGSSPDSLICALLWPKQKLPLPPSPLFAEHFPGRHHADERFALIIAPGEFGLYDCGLDRLVAKRADGFDPDPQFWDGDDGVLRFELDLSGLPPGIERALLLAR